MLLPSNPAGEDSTTTKEETNFSGMFSGFLRGLLGLVHSRENVVVARRNDVQEEGVKFIFDASVASACDFASINTLDEVDEDFRSLD